MSVKGMSREGFRLDINGLRAWAVVAVVLFHFGVPGFSGGFSGVDVFFVISGFLMAGIVIGGLEQGRFSLFGFYMARARRIVPALLVAVAAVLVAGAFILMPGDYQELGRHARESVLFTSNHRYLAEAGYFDTASHEKWLLHTWSLAVEWQFYLIYPLALVLVQRVLPGRTGMLWLHVAVLLASLGLSVFWVMEAPERAFYLLPARAWEMLLGGTVFLLVGARVMPARSQRACEWTGFGLILATLFLVDAGSPWPGALALLPTLGAALVLGAGCQGSIWTGSRAAQWLGMRSYSIYLWHWPLAVGLTYFGHERDWGWIALAISASLLLGHLSYHLVEVPARRWLSGRSNLRALGWLLVALIVVTVAAQMVRRSGFPERLPDAIAAIEAERHNKNPRQDECLDAEARCVFGGDQIAALVIGDSHADSIVTAVTDALPDPQQGVYFKAESGCLLVQGAHAIRPGKQKDCEALKQELFDGLDTLHPGVPVILINRVTAYAMGDGFDDPALAPQAPTVYFSRKAREPDAEFLAEFRQHYLDSTCRLAQGRDLYVLMPVPEMPAEVPKAMGRAMLRGLSADVFSTRAQYQARHTFVRGLMQEAAERCNVKLLDPVPYFCNEEICRGQREGVPLYVDDDHLSEHGNRLLVPLFAPLFAGPAATTPSGE